jgi:hypothetical protein
MSNSTGFQIVAAIFGLVLVLPQALGILSINKKLLTPRVDTGSQMGLRSYRAFLITWLVPNIPIMLVLAGMGLYPNGAMGLLSTGLTFLYLSPVAWIVMIVFLINGFVYRSVKNRDRDYSAPAQNLTQPVATEPGK